MRKILKGREPDSLTEHRCQPDADYAGYREKDALRAALTEEQRGLCCYCMSRIEAATATIEHWYPQAQYRQDRNTGAVAANHGDLDYRNLLASCKGNEGTSPKDQHCGARKGDRLLKYNPADDGVDLKILFSGDGSVSSTDSDFKQQLDRVLNLNAARLRNQRQEVLAGFTEAIKHRFGGKAAPRRFLKAKLDEWNGDSSQGHLHPFCQVVVFWIRKRLKGSEHGLEL